MIDAASSKNEKRALEIHLTAGDLAWARHVIDATDPASAVALYIKRAVGYIAQDRTAAHFPPPLTRPALSGGRVGELFRSGSPHKEPSD